mmetsp:Transcript_24990/g.69144  ORF Transcript_24990/g.69144 Transcript_24990/m.69144 type:complete len:245 (-) Transcript_24990:2654-3388(-)
MMFCRFLITTLLCERAASLLSPLARRTGSNWGAHSSVIRRCRTSFLSAVPTLDQLENDSFMQQVTHSETLVGLLAAIKEEDDDSQKVNLINLLKAQLSHSDGIRGFFVTYLTAIGGNEVSPADTETVPSALVEAMRDVDPQELVPLACMNVVMPTAMITMHKDADLSAQSQITAERGLRVLQCLLSDLDSDVTRRNCQAILSVATKEEGGEDLVSYWQDFFEKWGYQDLQKRDIAQAMRVALRE